MTTTKLSARRPEDLLAAVPVLLGFAPQRSIVMLTFGGEVQFHGRIDLPPPDHLDECISSLLAPAVRHGVRAVVMVLYDAGPALASSIAHELARRVDGCGLRLVGCLSVDGGRWFDPLDMHGAPSEGVAFCVEEHEFLARAVADGHVTLGSRAELEATVAPVAEQVAETQAALTSAVPLRAGEIGLVVAAGVRGRPLGPDRVASLLLALAMPGLRDQMWGRMRRDDARAQVTFWSDVVRRSPAPLVGDAAAVLAFAAWLVGDGALAWCALDRCFAQDQRNSLGLLVARMLDGAIPPSEWERAVAGVSTREPA